MKVPLSPSEDDTAKYWVVCFATLRWRVTAAPPPAPVTAAPHEAHERPSGVSRPVNPFGWSVTVTERAAPEVAGFVTE